MEKEKDRFSAMSLFLREKPAKLLLALGTTSKKPKYVSTLSREINCTYSHTVRLLDEFRKFGLVKFMKVSRVKYIELTEEGKDLMLQLEGIVRKLSKLNPTEIKNKEK
jgi:DNA-binding MarR family transcriptional regulator